MVLQSPKATLLRLRLHQMRRIIHELGVLYSFFAAFLLIASIGVLFQYSSSDYFYVYYPVVLIIVNGSFHRLRKDAAFILRHLHVPETCMAVEYVFFNSLLGIPLLTEVEIASYVLLLISVGVLPWFIGLGNSSKGKTFSLQWLPAHLFEWKSGIRQSLGAFIFFLLGASIGLYWPFATLIFLWLLTGLITSWYQDSESEQMLRAAGLSAKEFIGKKFILHLGTFSIIQIPFLIVYCILHADSAYIAVLFFPMQLIQLFFAISLKYSMYEPGERLRVHAFLIGFAHLSGFIPFLAPIPLFMGVRYTFKAFSQLDSYLND